MSVAQEVEEVVVPKDLKEFLEDVVERRHGFSLGEPWKYSEKALAVVVPVLRPDAPRRMYTTMYEVLKELGMKDTGHIDAVQLQNKTGKAVFVRAGTIFEGGTQTRAAQNSGVYQPGKSDVPVNCVYQTRGISQGADMKFGDIAPMSVTMNLISQAGQEAVWESVRRYTGGDKSVRRVRSPRLRRIRRGGFTPRSQVSRVEPATFHSPVGARSVTYLSSEQSTGGRGQSSRRRFRSSGDDDRVLGIDADHSEYEQGNSSDPGGYFVGYCAVTPTNGLTGTGTDDLLGHMKGMEEGKKMLDDMMQRVPLFEGQVGAIIFGPVGVIAVETFDSPKSWEAIKKEIIEKHGDKICNEQADHLFELKPEMIEPALRRFIEGLKVYKEQTVRIDEFSETRILVGENIVGEYTLVKKRVIHTILVREMA